MCVLPLQEINFNLMQMNLISLAKRLSFISDQLFVWTTIFIITRISNYQFFKHIQLDY